MIISKIILMPKPILMLNVCNLMSLTMMMANCWNNRIDTIGIMMLTTMPMMIPTMMTMMTTTMMMMMMMTKMMMTHVVGQTAVPKSPIHYSVGEPACLLAGTSKF